MAFTSIPKDLSKIKTKIALNLTKRQLICFSVAAVIGIPTYIFTRAALGNTGAALLMMGLMLPPFFLAMYEKDGLPAEIILRNYIRARFYWPGTRPYKTENFYAILEKEAKSIATESTAAAKAPVGKRPSGKGKPRGRKKIRAKRKKQR
jgi:hypothetical protein